MFRMVLVRSRIPLVIAFVMTVATTAHGQLPATRLSAVFPPGAKIGTTVEVAVTSGVDLEGLYQLQFNHPGIKAVQKMQDSGGKPTPVPNVFVVSVASNVPPGQYEVCAVGFFGISNPRFFVVGAHQELSEAEPNNTREAANLIEINQTMNGRMNHSTDVDWFKFTGKTGQRVLLNCMGRRLDSKLDAALEVYNSAGKRLEFVRRNLGSLDALLDINVPSDGEYFIKLYDFTYAGGEDYSYRLMFTTAPFIDFVLPTSGIPDSNAQYTLYGRNLPGSVPTGLSIRGRPLEKLTVNISLPATNDLLDPKVVLEPLSAGIDAVPYSIDSPAGPSNVVLIQLGKFVPVIEVEPNDNGSTAQKIVVPIEVEGQFQTRNDIDCFQFEAKAKDTYWIEVIAHRAGAAIDPTLVIDQVKTNDRGEQSFSRISAVDDDASNPLVNLFQTVNDDTTVKFVAPEDGTFRITLRERYGNVKQDLSVYRLIIRKETPDFRVAAITTTLTDPAQPQGVPSGINLRRGDHYRVHVMAFRRDGFSAPITISAEGLPPGVTCREVSIGTAPSSGVIVFTSTDDAPAWAGTIRLVARATFENPVCVEAWQSAKAKLKTSSEALAVAEQTVAKTKNELTSANDEVKAAKSELAAKSDDNLLKQNVAKAEARVIAAATEVQRSTDAKTAAEKVFVEAQTLLQQSEAAKNAACREVAHPVRYGTVVWAAPSPHQPTDTRVAQSMELSVIDEPAPFQLMTDVHRIDVNQNRQLFVPVKLIRRNGFDQSVFVNVLSQPPNAAVENKPIPKDKTEEWFRFYIPANTPPGTYVTYLTGFAPVSYRKNPKKADVAKAEFEVASNADNVATEALKSAASVRDGLVQKYNETAVNLKKLAEVKQQLEKNVTDARAVELAVVELSKNPAENSDSIEKKLAEARTSTQSASNALENIEKAIVEISSSLKQVEEAKTAAEVAYKKVEEQKKTTATEKTAAEQRFQAADNYAKPSNINFYPTSSPIVFNVKPAPYTIAASPADGGAIKIGARLEVKCEIKRQNGFTGPVTLLLAVPPNTTGIKAEPVFIPDNQSTGILILEAAADTAEAQLSNVMIRAVSDWEGEAIVDQPIALKTVK